MPFLQATQKLYLTIIQVPQLRAVKTVAICSKQSTLNERIKFGKDIGLTHCSADRQVLLSNINNI